MSAPILPGATLGVLGGGQLGRMFALAARRMGYRVHVLCPDEDAPASQVADHTVRAAYDDLDAVDAFARGVAAVTFEFENIPHTSAERAARWAPVRPGPHVLQTTQHRAREKSTLAARGLPVTPFRAARSPAELDAAVAALGAPAVLKSAAWGYDGKGQTLLRAPGDAAAAWERLATDDTVLEAFIDFEREISVVAARGADGAFADFGVLHNEHFQHILDVTTAPADLPPRVRDEAIEIAREVLSALDVVGVLCVEMFLKPDGSLLINETAPRPHNSGHLTIDACATDQFEQQVRALCGLPLGDPALLRPAAMANLLGDLWRDGEPDWPAALALPPVKLHLYGKREARPGRKMGHLTALAPTAAEARALVLEARRRLTAARPPGAGGR
jgi:5-(carboxyamino)imidazole ribonucleotide synthase